jgi:hypothetical protein
MYINEATLNLSGIMNKHNSRIWGNQPPQQITEHQREIPKVSMWCGMIKDHITETFSFQEATMISHLNLDMLEHCAVPQLPCDASIQLDGMLPHFENTARQFLN